MRKRPSPLRQTANEGLRNPLNGAVRPMDRTVTALLPRGPQTAVLPVHQTMEHPSFVNALPNIIAPARPQTTCGDCEVIDYAISIGLHIDDYVELQWRHKRAMHGGAS